MMRVTGTVVRGDRRGAAIGFPTANIGFHDPDFAGIYAGRATVAGTVYGAAIYIDPSRRLLEAHLLDFEGNLYDAEISVDILMKMRDSKAFESEALLRAAIGSDITAIREYLGTIS